MKLPPPSNPPYHRGRLPPTPLPFFSQGQIGPLKGISQFLLVEKFSDLPSPTVSPTPLATLMTKRAIKADMPHDNSIN